MAAGGRVIVTVQRPTVLGDRFGLWEKPDQSVENEAAKALFQFSGSVTGPASFQQPPVDPPTQTGREGDVRRPTAQSPHPVGEKRGPDAVEGHPMRGSGDGQGDYLWVGVDFPNTQPTFG